jgi:hypothetical protein
MDHIAEGRGFDDKYIHKNFTGSVGSSKTVVLLDLFKGMQDMPVTIALVADLVAGGDEAGQTVETGFQPHFDAIQQKKRARMAVPVQFPDIEVPAAVKQPDVLEGTGLATDVDDALPGQYFAPLPLLHQAVGKFRILVIEKEILVE